jgi:hypothetical protein
MLHNNDMLQPWEQKLISRAARLSGQPGTGTAADRIGKDPTDPSDRSDTDGGPHRISIAGRRIKRSRHAATIELRLASLFED